MEQNEGFKQVVDDDGLVNSNIPHEPVIPIPRGKEYHAFFCHNSEDSDWVENCMQYLEEKYHMKCCSYQEHFPVGKPLIQSMEKAVASSAITLLIVTSNFLKSGFCEEESRMAHMAKMQKKAGLITVKMENCDIPLWMEADKYLDITEDTNQEVAYNKIYMTILNVLDPAEQTYVATSASLDTDNDSIICRSPTDIWIRVSAEDDSTICLFGGNYKFDLNDFTHCLIIDSILEIASKQEYVMIRKCYDAWWTALMVVLFLVLVVLIIWTEQSTHSFAIFDPLSYSYNYLEGIETGYKTAVYTTCISWILLVLFLERIFEAPYRCRKEKEAFGIMAIVNSALCRMNILARLHRSDHPTLTFIWFDFDPCLTYIEYNLVEKRGNLQYLSLTEILENEIVEYTELLATDPCRFSMVIPPSPSRHVTGRRIHCLCTHVEKGRKYLKYPRLDRIERTIRQCGIFSGCLSTYTHVQENNINENDTQHDLV